MTVDIRKSIEAKSDRLNADDLMGAPITITIEDVKAGNAESPVAVYYNGCNGKPWYPCTIRPVCVFTKPFNCSGFLFCNIRPCVEG